MAEAAPNLEEAEKASGIQVGSDSARLEEAGNGRKTGAGDTVAATFSGALLAGGSFLEASALANVAAGLVVMKRGTATVSPEEIGRALGHA